MTKWVDALGRPVEIGNLLWRRTPEPLTCEMLEDRTFGPDSLCHECARLGNINFECGELVFEVDTINNFGDTK